MSVALLDVNVLIALGWPNHIHHKIANDWFDSQDNLVWATCPITQCGFVRISSNPRLSPAAVKPLVASALLQKMTALPGHIFWPDDLEIAAAINTPGVSLVGHNQVTDGYLVALAMKHVGRLVTFDRAIRTLGTTSAVEVIRSDPSSSL